MDDSNVARETTPAASVHPLAHVRRRHGWSYQDLARVIADHARALGVPMAARREKVWRWEHWGVVPEADSQRALARALGIAPRELELRPWPRWLPAQTGMPDGLPWTADGSRAALDALLDDGPADPYVLPVVAGETLRGVIAEWDAAVVTAVDPAAASPGTARAGGGAPGEHEGGGGRDGDGGGAVRGERGGRGGRDRLNGGAGRDGGAERARAAAVRAPSRVPEQVGAPGAVDTAMLDWLDAGVLGLRRLDDRLGGAAVQHRVEADLRLVRDLLDRRPQGRPERRLLRIAADLAQLGGWAATDSGRHGAAQCHYLTGLRLAHAAGDRPLTVALWGGLALQAVITGQPQDALAAAEAAVRGAGGTPAAVRALAACRLARAHAALGSEGAFRRAAAEAERRLDAAEHDPGPPWLYWFDTAELAAQQGLALLDLGLPHEARPLLEQALATQETSYVRERALYSARTAQARELTGDPDAARALARDAARLARHCPSPRLTEALDAIAPLLATPR
jgi:tetratricopeptide (TPR) repeat protein